MQNPDESGRFEDKRSETRHLSDQAHGPTLLERLHESRRQLDAGEYTEYDEAGLNQLFLTLTEQAVAASRTQIGKSGT